MQADACVRRGDSSPASHFLEGLAVDIDHLEDRRIRRLQAGQYDRDALAIRPVRIALLCDGGGVHRELGERPAVRLITPYIVHRSVDEHATEPRSKSLAILERFGSSKRIHAGIVKNIVGGMSLADEPRDRRKPTTAIRDHVTEILLGGWQLRTFAWS